MFLPVFIFFVSFSHFLRLVLRVVPFIPAKLRIIKKHQSSQLWMALSARWAPGQWGCKCHNYESRYDKPNHVSDFFNIQKQYTNIVNPK